MISENYTDLQKLAIKCRNIAIAKHTNKINDIFIWKGAFDHLAIGPEIGTVNAVFSSDDWEEVKGVKEVMILILPEELKMSESETNKYIKNLEDKKECKRNKILDEYEIYLKLKEIYG